jgi:dihydropteroate synthase
MLGEKHRHPLVMGVLNITPDSFSDGGKYLSIQAAVQQAVAMVEQGAELIDIGGESTRPGSQPVDESVQISRVIPVIRAIRDKGLAAAEVPISIDTTRAKVAEAALDAGANVVNDISAGLDDPALLLLVADRRVPVILMHMQGRPATMQNNPVYGDVVDEVREFLFSRLSYARTIGIDPADVLLDPGIGFGKTAEHNLQLLGRLSELAVLGCPLVVGTSRKGFIGTVTGEQGDRTFGTAGTVAWAAANGAGIVRVHDVAGMSKVVAMVRAIREITPQNIPGANVTDDGRSVKAEI